MAAAWKAKLQTASFRGVPFYFESEDMEAGRRVQVHEYPQRDKPYAEDMGRATREINLVGFVIGPDYMAERDKLLGAIEQAGPGTLVHPWYGSMSVFAKPCRVAHSVAEGGMARFTLAFVEAGELSFPTSAADTGTKARIGADDARKSVLDQFAKVFNTAGKPDFVQADAKTESLSLIAQTTVGLRAIVSSVTGQGSSVSNDLDALLRDPRELGSALQSLFGVASAIADNPNQAQNAVHSLLALFALPAWSSPSRPAQYTVSDSRLQQIDNTTALRSLMRQTALADAAGAASLMPAVVYDDTLNVRRALFDALDSEALQAGDDAFVALGDLRVKSARDLIDRARDSARLYAYTPREVMPAVVLAYELYEDPERGAEIVARNALRHPGYVPARALQVLSR